MGLFICWAQESVGTIYRNRSIDGIEQFVENLWSNALSFANPNAKQDKPIHSSDTTTRSHGLFIEERLTVLEPASEQFNHKEQLSSFPYGQCNVEHPSCE